MVIYGFPLARRPTTGLSPLSPETQTGDSDSQLADSGINCSTTAKKVSVGADEKEEKQQTVTVVSKQDFGENYGK